MKSHWALPCLQTAILQLQADNTVATADDPSIVMGTLPVSFVQQTKRHLRPGMLLRFAIGDAGMQIVDGRPVSADIKYIGAANQRRGGADSFTKILFQYQARRAPLTFEELLTACTEDAME